MGSSNSCHAEIAKQIQEQIEGMIEGKMLVPMAERRIVALDGMIVDVEMLAASFTDDEGPAVLVVLHDISERKRLQAQCGGPSGLPNSARWRAGWHTRSALR